jgi:hypothetical protein
MNTDLVCAALGCENRVTRRIGHPGRPPMYCSPECRPSRSGQSRQGLVVEVEAEQASEGEAQGPHRDWLVRLRRGGQSVVIRRGLGRFSAKAFATELHQLIAPTRQEGGAID